MVVVPPQSSRGPRPETPFPVAVLSDWDGPRYVAFEKIRQGQLREVTLGHGTRWSPGPWCEVTSLDPNDALRNAGAEVSTIAAFRLDALVNDFQVRNLPLPRRGDSEIEMETFFVDGSLCELHLLEHRAGIHVAGLKHRERALVVAWADPEETARVADLTWTTDLTAYAIEE